MPELLALLDLRGALVSLDALSCQPTGAQQILAQGGDYLLGLKANQPTLLADAERQTLSLPLEAAATGPTRGMVRRCATASGRKPTCAGWTKTTAGRGDSAWCAWKRCGRQTQINPLFNSAITSAAVPWPRRRPTGPCAGTGYWALGTGPLKMPWHLAP